MVLLVIRLSVWVIAVLEQRAQGNICVHALRVCVCVCVCVFTVTDGDILFHFL